MGYRSEVTIRCEKKAYNLFKEVFAIKEYCIAPHKIYKYGDDYILYWEWTKWYEEFEEIQAVTAVMDKLDDRENEDGYSYKFIRFGEDYEDVETRTNNWSIELWLTRKIDIPDGFEELTS